MRLSFSIFVIVYFFFALKTNYSKEFRVGQVPNGSKFGCNTCHTNGGGTPRNEFGRLVQKSFLVNSGLRFDVNWTPLLASLDADNDGVSNGEELQDPFGLWNSGQSNPGEQNLLSAPGVNSSTPFKNLTINFSEMSPHIGQTLWLRVVNNTNTKEVYRESITVEESFSLIIDKILVNNDYDIDLFVDHNENGEYDHPPADHSWRISYNNAQANEVIEFSHNEDFIDIYWPNILKVNFTDMAQYVGKLIEIKLQDKNTLKEIVRSRIERIPSSEFIIELPGIMKGNSYRTTLYVDVNNNGLFDNLPADHAWEIDFDSETTTNYIDFTNNSNYSEINWDYLYTLNFSNMESLVNMNFEMRIVSSDRINEVNRISSIISGDNFSLAIPEIIKGDDYLVEFYSDVNENGIYDSPPTDQAWRLSFNSSTGTFVQNFTYNDNFVDIGWEEITDIKNEDIILNSFILNQNYPNPFNPSTAITFNLKKTANVSLIIYNSLGQIVQTLINEKMSSGLHNANFEAFNLTSGIYYYQLNSEGYSETKKMLLLK